MENQPQMIVQSKSHQDQYLDSARKGENSWVRYFLSVLLILFMWQIMGAIPYVILLVWAFASGRISRLQDLNSLATAAPLANFVGLMLASVFFIIGIFLAVRFIHRRPFRSLVTPVGSIAWGRIFQGFVAWLVLTVLASLVEALIYPGRYVLTFNAAAFIPFFILALLLVPIQTSAEELFFRAYVLQTVGLRNRNTWLLSAISGFLFMLPHFLNPEASVNYPLLGLYYFSMGAFLAYMTLKDGRLELALGVHAANNLFSLLAANYKISVITSPSIFTVNVLDAVYSVPAGLICMAIFVALFLTVLRRRD